MVDALHPELEQILKLKEYRIRQVILNHGLSPALDEWLKTMKTATSSWQRKMSRITSKQLLKYLVCLSVLLLLSACEVNRLRSIEEHYRQRRYAAAIQEADEFIRKAANGAFITEPSWHAAAPITIGLMSLQRDNQELALKFFKLSILKRQTRTWPLSTNRGSRKPSKPTTMKSSSST